MKTIEEALTPGEWKGEPAFVVGGGPSLRGVDLSPFLSGYTVGVNMAYRYNPTIAYIGDIRLLERLEDKGYQDWKDCTSTRVVHEAISNMRGNDKPERLGIYWVRVNNSPGWWGTDFERGVFPGNNSGIVALNIATVMGADPVFLLGFDMRGEEAPDGKRRAAHWHEEYPRKWRNLEEHYAKFIAHFERARGLWEKRGGTRVLVVGDSALPSSITRCTLQDALSHTRRVAMRS